MAPVREDFQIHIDGVKHYFGQLGVDALTIHPPYIPSQPVRSLGYTGTISISGNRKGEVHFSANPPLLFALLDQLGEQGRDRGYLQDVVGEVANTLSGNLRREFGKGFAISTPAVSFDPTSDIHVYDQQATSLVIPMSWGEGSAALVVSLSRSHRP